MRHATERHVATQTSAPFTPPTLFDISTFNHVAQRPTAQPCAAPRVDASRLPVRNHDRISRGGQQKRLADMAALAASQTVAQTDSLHVCQIPLADMAELADMTAKTMGREFFADSKRNQSANIRLIRENPRPILRLPNVCDANRVLSRPPAMPAAVAGHCNNLML
jgi:hypothetical protein